MYANIAQTLSETAAQHGGRNALIEAAGGRSCTFEELNRFADRYGAFCREQGIEPGQRVILMVRPSIDFIALTFALFRIGAPVILIDPGMGYKNLLSCIHRVRPDYLVGIPAAVGLSLVHRKKFSSVKKRFCCGSLPGLGFMDIRRQLSLPRRLDDPFTPDGDALAAIIFTTGSTGPPKGVRFEHSIFAAQLEKVRSFYDIGPGDTDQPGFPLFALFSTALAATAVIPDMDPTRPAMVDAEKFVGSLVEYEVTYSFGSPAIWNVVSSYCRDRKIRCSRLKKVLMAGAPVSGELIGRVYEMIGEGGEVHIPYGATESLPIISIEGREVIEQTWTETKKGKGACVGRPLPGVDMLVVEARDDAIEDITAARRCAVGEIAEIIVAGDVVTRAYDNNDEQNRISKIQDANRFWHRIGDVGYIDEQGRLWFCGRQGHRVHTRGGIKYTICCEAIVNRHAQVFRSALVGIDSGDRYQLPVIVIELARSASMKEERIIAEVRELCAQHPLTHDIAHVLVHPSFPVDIRHNAKIFREKLAVWAQDRLGYGR